MKTPPVRVWAIVNGFEEYEVSDDGLVRHTVWRNGSGSTKLDTPREMKPWVNCRGYRSVRLHRGGVGHTRLVHRLVLEAFVGACPVGHEAAHWNGVRTDNRVSNLRWATRADNHKDKWRHGTAQVGERANNARLTTESVMSIRARYASGESCKLIGADYGITPGHATRIGSGRAWRHLSDAALRGRRGR